MGFIAGNTEVHNNLVGHYNSGKVKYIYWDCLCLFEQLSDPKPQCQLVTLADFAHALLTDGVLKIFARKSLSMLLMIYH